MECALEAESEASLALRELGAFINVGEHISVPCFYSCEITTPLTPATSREPPYFGVFLVRRRSPAIESECHEDSSAIFHIVVVNEFLEAVRVIVACPTLTDARFTHSDWLPDNYVPGFEDLMSEVFSLLKFSPSLSCFHFRNDLADASLYCKHLPTLVCENPRLETLKVVAGGLNFGALAKAIAVCLSRNSVLKSFTLQFPPGDYDLSRHSLEILLRPLTSSSPSEANADLKELALYLQYSDAHCMDVIANLICRNTTLEKLDLRFLKFRSIYLKDGKSAWREIGRALEVNQTLKELSCFCDLAALRELLVPFVPDRYGRQPNTTLSTLRLFVSNDLNGRWLHALVNNLGVVLKDLASALESNTTLKHVQLIYEWDGYETNQWDDDVKYVTDKDLWRVEFQIQEILKVMRSNELRVNTSLESFAVGNWTLRRVGTEWQTSYRGPCLREQTREYTVKVTMAP
ncbi:hypothetical protein M758_4G171800 [Ceratodon purpureus]|nr:hypothetical protein M758_4G171800 [Ceratodon purpureus]